MNQDNQNTSIARTAELLQRYFAADISPRESEELAAAADAHFKCPDSSLPPELDSDLRLVAAIRNLDPEKAWGGIPETAVPDKFEERWNRAVHKAATKRKIPSLSGLRRHRYAVAASVAVALLSTATWRFTSMPDTHLDINTRQEQTLILAKAEPKVTAEASGQKEPSEKRASVHNGIPEQTAATVETKHTPTGNVHTGDIEYSHPESTEETDLEELSSEPVFLPAVASLPADRGQVQSTAFMTRPSKAWPEWPFRSKAYSTDSACQTPTATQNQKPHRYEKVDHNSHSCHSHGIVFTCQGKGILQGNLHASRSELHVHIPVHAVIHGRPFHKHKGIFNQRNPAAFSGDSADFRSRTVGAEST